MVSKLEHRRGGQCFDRRKRLERLFQALEGARLDWIALVPGPDMYYFTGLEGFLSERPIVVFISSQGASGLVGPDFEIPRIAEQIAWQPQFFVYSDKEGPAKAFREASRKLKLGDSSIGINFYSMRVLEWHLIKSVAPRATVANVRPLLMKLRTVKDAQEIAAIRKAVTITEVAMQRTVSQIRPGLTEVDVRRLLIQELWAAGADGVAFDPIVVSGPRTVLQHASPSHRVLREGDLLIIDCGARFHHYLSDITRTFVLGSASPQTKGMYEIVLEANTVARESVKPGITAEDIDRAARTVIKKAGYGDYFFHRTGHGVGLEIHEAPYIVEGNQECLEPGMVFTIEPGIYLPDMGGVRVEDVVLVDEGGNITMTNFERSLIVL